MVLLHHKTRKIIWKELKKLVIKHGLQVAVGLLTGLITSYFAEDARDEEGETKKHKKKKKSKKHDRV